MMIESYDFYRDKDFGKEKCHVFPSVSPFIPFVVFCMNDANRKTPPGRSLLSNLSD